MTSFDFKGRGKTCCEIWSYNENHGLNILRFIDFFPKNFLPHTFTDLSKPKISLLLRCVRQLLTVAETTWSFLCDGHHGLIERRITNTAVDIVCTRLLR